MFFFKGINVAGSDKLVDLTGFEPRTKTKFGAGQAGDFCNANMGLACYRPGLRGSRTLDLYPLPFGPERI